MPNTPQRQREIAVVAAGQGESRQRAVVRRMASSRGSRGKASSQVITLIRGFCCGSSQARATASPRNTSTRMLVSSASSGRSRLGPRQPPLTTLVRLVTAAQSPARRQPSSSPAWNGTSASSPSPRRWGTR